MISEKDTGIFALLGLLALTLIAMAFLVNVYGLPWQSYEDEPLRFNETTRLVGVSTNSKLAVSSDRVIVTDRYVGDINPDSNIVVKSSSGRYIDVWSGDVLIHNTHISVSDEHYSIHRRDNMRTSISS